jgi:hypothetical protein
MDIECLNPAYEKIKNSEVYNSIINKKEVLRDIFLFNSPYIECLDDTFENIRSFYFNKNRRISEKSKVFENILLLQRDIEDENYFPFSDFEKVLLNHPCFLAYVILEDEIFDYKKFKFPSIKSLSEAVTSFCIGERVFGNEYVWRLNGFKNKISQNTHGDLYVNQSNVSGKISLEKNLFEDEEIFETYANVFVSGISAFQEWSQFLIASLKYAKYLGKEKMREIVNWKDVLEDVGGGVGTNTAEAEFGTDFSKYHLESLMNYPVLQNGIKIEQFPLHIYFDTNHCFYPFFDKGKLFYLIEKESGDILMENFSNVDNDKKFSKVLEYSKEDLPHILTAAYKYFARDRSKMYKIMDYFNSKHI